MSKLSHWWHGWVDGLGLSPGASSFLHSYGLLFVWAAMIGLPLILIALAVFFLAAHR